MLAPRALRCFLLCALSCAWLHRTGAASRLKSSSSSSSSLPIQSEREPLPSKGLSGCSFGGRFYSLEDSWHPDLGEPFGVMHCVLCLCETQKGRRGKVFGKVNCKNVKQDCPDPDCEEPVLLPGHCCRTCPKGDKDSLLDGFEYFQESSKDKDDDLHKSYNDRSYLSSEELDPGESRTDFVAVLTGVTDSWLPSSNGVARARFSLTRSSLAFSVTYQRMTRPSRILLLDADGSTAFEYRVPRGAADMICGVWKNLAKPLMRRLQAELMRISMSTTAAAGGRGEVEGKVIKHRALFAETFSSTLTSEEENSGAGGLAMLTLSDTESNLHFILILQGLVKHRGREPVVLPLRVQLAYRQHVLREIRANVTSHDPDFAEVLTDLNSRELFWLSRGQLEITVATEGPEPRKISGYITGRKSCDSESCDRSQRPAQGVLKDISSELLQHLDRGSAFIQVSTKTNPRGEIRGQVHVSNSCESGSRAAAAAAPEEAELDDPEQLKKDPQACFFENRHHGHGARWTPDYDKCFSCSCRKRTVICDPVICSPLSCSRTLQRAEQCCPVCDEQRADSHDASERVEEHPEGCYFEGDQKMHAPGTTWHPFVPPFGFIKCAVCTCKGSSGEVHCEKVTCPLLLCSRPVRRSPSDCCKACPEEAEPPVASTPHADSMQADGPRSCKFGKSFYQNSDNWHPWVPLVGEMKCINCWCDHGVTKCQRKQCPVLTCSGIARREAACCPECLESKEEDDVTMKAPDKRRSWGH
ncbi:chordin [Clinocottus analis]|uniref:chordin n=1 Tax=Clinocottus analis TaxID=304258 RepID=UPI0035C166BD